MSFELLERIKQQAKELSPQEKDLLAKFILEERETVTELGLYSKGDNEEKRRLCQQWIKANREKYGGQYIALDGDKLPGVGKNYPEAYQKAIAAGVKDAFVGFLPPTDYVGKMGGWL